MFGIKKMTKRFYVLIKDKYENDILIHTFEMKREATLTEIYKFIYNNISTNTTKEWLLTDEEAKELDLLLHQIMIDDRTTKNI